MSKVIFSLAMSVDGYMGGAGEQALPVHNRLLGWVHDLASWRRAAGLEGGLANRDDDVIKEQAARVGAHVMGRLMFDRGEEPWGDNPPFQASVFILTNQARETVAKAGGTTYTFVTDGIASAIAQAKAAAGEKDVRVEGGANAVQQAIRAGQVDEFDLQLIPVLLGGGIRPFDHIGAGQIELEPTRVIDSPKLTHPRYHVVK
ncbi:MAG: dihydrofolate reductase family protein [Chloroflexota bacterium]|nr:dihydrofolate reductase family protein [Chloroflexota bacterium]